MSNKPSIGSKMGRNAFSTVTSASFGTVTSVVLDAIVIAIFGMGRQTDAYFIANTIPIVFATILGLQGTRVIQPIFLTKRETEGEAAGWDYLNLMMTNGTAILGVICLVGILLSPILMRVQEAGSSEGTGIAVKVSVLTFALLPLSFSVVVMRSVLRTFDMFAMPAASKLFENLAKIVCVLFLGQRLGVQALVVGLFVGTLWQLLMFYVILKRRGFRFRLILGPKHPDMIQAYRLVSFQITGQICGAGVEVVNNTLGSMLGAGNVTALRLATRVIDSFAGLLPASVVEAAMPAVAESSARGDMDATKRHVRRAFHLLLLVTLPLSVWLGLTRGQVIALLYQRANFSSADTALVSMLLLLMIPYMFLGRLRSLFELPFFAEQNTWTPLVASITESVLYVLGSLFLAKRLGIFALPIGRALASFVGPWVLGYLLRRRIGSLGFGEMWSSTVRICAACLVMAAFILMGTFFVSFLPVHGFSLRVIALGVPTVTGAIGIGISLFALGVLDLSILGQNGLLPRQWSSRLMALTKLAPKPQ